MTEDKDGDMLDGIDDGDTLVAFEVMALVGVVDADVLCDGLLECVTVGDDVWSTLPLGIDDADGFIEGMFVSTAALG